MYARAQQKGGQGHMQKAFFPSPCLGAKKINQFKYINRQHHLRSPGCRNCMGEGCRASNASRKVSLLRRLKAVHGEKIYAEYLGVLE